MVFDVSNVDAPKLLGRSPVFGSPVEMTVQGGVATMILGDWYGVNDVGEPFGFERFEGVILSRGTKGADVLKQALLESVKTFTRNRPPEDDQTLVVVSFEDRQVVALRAS